MKLFESRDDKVNALLDESDSDIVNIGDQRPKRFVSKLTIFIIGVCFVIVIWWIVAFIYNNYMIVYLKFPDPVSAFGRFFEFLEGEYRIYGKTIMEHSFASLRRWMLGFVIAFGIGTLIGIVLSMSERMFQFGIVPVNIMQTIPGLAWFPVTILLFGFGEWSAIFIIVVTVCVPIALSVCNGLRKVPKVNKRVAAMYGKGKVDTFTKVLLPFSLLDIVSGARIAMAMGWRILISAEMVVGVALGLGFAINSTTYLIDYKSAFACIIIICIIGLIIDKLILSNLETYARRKLGVEES